MARDEREALSQRICNFYNDSANKSVKIAVNYSLSRYPIGNCELKRTVKPILHGGIFPVEYFQRTYKRKTIHKNQESLPFIHHICV